jgi:Spy/CpxP family protein refolding chaperone
VSSALTGITSSLATSQSENSASISIPTNLTPAQDAEVQSILGQLASGSITAAQAESEISAISSSGGQSSSGTQGAAGTHPHHGHHGEHAAKADGASGAQTLTSALGLTSTQESQIASIVQSAQQSNAEPTTVLSQIEGVLTPEQQQKLAQLLAPTYSSVGTGTGSQPPLFSTTA